MGILDLPETSVSASADKISAEVCFQSAVSCVADAGVFTEDQFMALDAAFACIQKAVALKVSERINAAASDVLYADPHEFSTRPCGTCRAITAMTGKPFGCSRKAIEAKG